MEIVEKKGKPSGVGKEGRDGDSFICVKLVVFTIECMANNDGGVVLCVGNIENRTSRYE